MNRVALIIPPSPFLLDERVFMNIGILKVAAVMEKNGIPIDMIDLSGITNYTDVVRDYCAFNPAYLFGITATTPQLPASMSILSTIRRYAPMARVILGGPHVTLVNSAAKQEYAANRIGRASGALSQLKKDFDVLVAGDGEDSIFEAIKDSSPKLIDADNLKSPLFLNDKRLSEQPFPARHLLDVGSYHYAIDGVPALSLIAQLGCPFECGFCGGRSSPFLRKIRTRTNENIIAEMTDIYKTYGIRGFMLYDDELNVNRGLVQLMNAISERQNELGTEFRLRGFIKSELFNEEQARAMYNAGFRWILVGFESGSPRILNNINKKASREENTRALKIAQQCGLKVKALMSIGHPGESEHTAIETMDWLLETKPDDFDITIITTYPGTPYYDEAVQNPKNTDEWVYTYSKTGDRLYSVEVDYRITSDYYKGKPDGGYVSFVYTDYLSREQLVTLRDKIESEVRNKLGIPFNHSTPAALYEHSMGQRGRLPSHIFKSTP